MSKTITSLIASLLLAFSVTSNALAQINEGGHRTLFRPTNVMSAEDVDKGVNHFEGGKMVSIGK